MMQDESPKWRNFASNRRLNSAINSTGKRQTKTMYAVKLSYPLTKKIKKEIT